MIMIAEMEMIHVNGVASACRAEDSGEPALFLAVILTTFYCRRHITHERCSEQEDVNSDNKAHPSEVAFKLLQV